MNNKQFSNKQEKHIAKRIGGRKQPNSGATLFLKGDVVSASFLLEAKTKKEFSKSFSIKREWIDKIKSEAFSMRKPYWSLVFNFGGIDNKQNYYIIDERLFSELVRLLEEED